MQLQEKNKGSKTEGNTLEGNKLEGTNPASEALVAANAAYEMALDAIEAAKLAITVEGAKPFKLYGNLLPDEAQQPWKKIIKAQVTRAPWEDKGGRTHGDSYQDLGLIHRASRSICYRCLVMM